MSTYKNSEYIIWTDDNGQYWLRIRRTGEQTPISNEIAQAIWAEMKYEETYQKKVTFIDSEGHRRSRLLSLDAINSENSERSIIRNEQWIGIRENGFEKVDADILEERLLKKLTKRQRQVYQLIVKDGHTLSECADICGISATAVSHLLEKIARKYVKFSEGG